MRIVKRFLIADPGASFSFKESFYRLRSLVEHGMPKQNEGEEKPAHVIMVSSVAASEGKSTVAANPALSLAQKHRAVLLIDADLRNPSQIRMLGKDAAGPVSLAKLLQSELLTAKQIADAIVYDDETHLMTLLDVAPTKNPGHLLSSESMRRLLSVCRRTMDYIVIDTPPVGLFADSGKLTDMADGMVLVVRQDVVPACDINDAGDVLSQGKAKLLGSLPEKTALAFTWGPGPTRLEVRA